MISIIHNTRIKPILLHGDVFNNNFEYQTHSYPALYIFDYGGMTIGSFAYSAQAAWQSIEQTLIIRRKVNTYYDDFKGVTIDVTHLKGLINK